jgi:predicted ribosomally synthesized peptide with nif11-like leader
MSKENLVKLLEAAAEDEQLGQQLQRASSYEDVKSLARQQGLDLGDLSEEEAGRTVGVVTGEISEELSDEELELVAGGFNIGMPPTLKFNIGMPPTLKTG